MRRFIFSCYLSVIAVCIFNGICAQTLNETESSTVSSTTQSTSTTSAKPPKNTSCEVHNNDCKACVAQSECYFCDENNQCHFHVQNIIDGRCKTENVHVLTCKINFKVMMIIIGALCGVVVLIILIVCCYCCCKKKGIKISKDDLKWARQKEERKQIAAERREERSKRTEEIRKKYGLVKDSNPYQKFDA